MRFYKNPIAFYKLIVYNNNWLQRKSLVWYSHYLTGDAISNKARSCLYVMCEITYKRLFSWEKKGRKKEMAERRMFAKTIIDSDAFLDMPLSTQSLYFHLSMRADDDGFINNPKKIQRMIGASDDDLKLLMAKSFIISFDSGVVVIKHWRIHNYIQKDRYKETVYLEEKEMLGIKENNAYTLEDKTLDTECIHDVYRLEAQDRIGKDSLGKVREGKDSKGKTPAPEKHKHGEYQHVLLKDAEFDKLVNELGEELTRACITYLDEYIEMKGYKAKSHYLCIKKWVVDAVKERRNKVTNYARPTKADELEASYNMMAQWAQGE